MKKTWKKMKKLTKKILSEFLWFGFQKKSRIIMNWCCNSPLRMTLMSVSIKGNKALMGSWKNLQALKTNVSKNLQRC
jgi:hypothetical protein